MSEKGKLIVVSGPSGAGKTTVITRVIEGRNDACFSTSVTSRSPRTGEVEGKDYFFITRERFLEMIENDELLEHACYVDNLYGTPRSFVEQKLEAGQNVFLDIEVQGARQVRKKMPEAIMIFLIPPSLSELKSRLLGRGTDSENVIAERLQRAREEYAEADFYDYIVVNDVVQNAADEINAILLADKCSFPNRRSMLYEAET